MLLLLRLIQLTFCWSHKKRACSFPSFTTMVKGATFVRRNKLDNLVHFPIEGLDLSKCVKGPSEKKHVYDLFAVSEHIGGMGGGHYTAICKNYRDEKWYDCNDSHVCEAQASDVSISQFFYFPTFIISFPLHKHILITEPCMK